MQNHYLLAAAVLATLLVSATSAGFDFYKLSLVWPTSACNVRSFCKTPYPNYFTIHGLWPQFANDTKVPRYSPTNRCVNITPTPVADLLRLLDEPIKKELEAKWPNLVKQPDRVLWEHEWEYHGMCSEYPNKPHEYFGAALTLAAKYDPLRVMRIKRGALTTTEMVLNNLYKKLRAYPQLSCNMNGKVRQLVEVRFCFDRTKPPSRLRSCPSRFDGACKTWKDTIKFP